MSHNGYATQRKIRLEEVVRIAKGRSLSAKAARVLISKKTSTWAAPVGHAQLDLSDCICLLCGVIILKPVKDLQHDPQSEYRTEVQQQHQKCAANESPDPGRDTE